MQGTRDGPEGDSPLARLIVRRDVNRGWVKVREREAPCSTIREGGVGHVQIPRGPEILTVAQNDIGPLIGHGLHPCRH